MGKWSAQKIDLERVYPCPCCRRAGRLRRITLTDAFGCERCQQIFVLKEGDQVLEQLGSTYPAQRAWYWDGQSWQRLYHVWGRMTPLTGFSLLLVRLPLLFLLFLLVVVLLAIFGFIQLVATWLNGR
ncbi:MAG: hypothetical protein NZL92_05570 [Gloeomargarita sp. SKYG116]|nr:hypothetical protein [Gloeomargarita sp. SKYG116]MCS7225445.1 hypothetical protein [Gloeomargarita sp. SKYB31]MDW8401145.1 hypothetical protein [Gloeomargarita sp. SKYGB_i_bin116]